MRVDNRLSFQTIPPGIVVDSPEGPKQKYWHDFFNYAGIHRDVWLCSRPTSHVEDVTITTDLDGDDGIVSWTVLSRNSDSLTTQVTIFDAEGYEVANGIGAYATTSIPSVHPWQPGQGYLYEAEISLLNGERVVDSYRQAFGVRTVRVDGNRLLINGEPVHLTGFGMHEDHQTIGKAHNDALMLRDAACLEWIGANFLRTSHYPYSEHVLDYADRHGLLVIDETPAVGMNMGLGGGILAPRATPPSPRRPSTARPRRFTPRSSATSSPVTRTTPASSSGPSPTSPSPRPRRQKTTSVPSSTWPVTLTPPAR